MNPKFMRRKTHALSPNTSIAGRKDFKTMILELRKISLPLSSLLINNTRTQTKNDTSPFRNEKIARIMSFENHTNQRVNSPNGHFILSNHTNTRRKNRRKHLKKYKKSRRIDICKNLYAGNKSVLYSPILVYNDVKVSKL
mmetsp:Transcript_14878/g.13078  ORF Transcript_14878/g.13078 Transcript_14878/m.13078 type:complete len:140 (+) Transcript_14878:555-974(+)